jgi:hypothetical protein
MVVEPVRKKLMDYVHPDASMWALGVTAPVEGALTPLGLTKSAAVINAAGDKVLAALATGKGLMAAIGTVASYVGYVSWGMWAQKEALEPASMAVRTALQAGDFVVARKALDNYEVMYRAFRDGLKAAGALPLGFGAGISAFADATASQIDSYEAALAALKKTQAAALAARWAKDKVASLKATNAVYEKNALEAMNAGDLKVGEQWLEKIADAGAREKARARVVKAATKTHKALASEALKRADAAEARNEAALIPDDVARAAMLGKIDAFELKVAAKAQKAQEAAARKAVAAQNKASQTAQRTAYFASLPEAQRPAWYAQAAAKAGAPGGAAEMAFGGVYYSAATGQYSVSTPSGMYRTSSAADAAAAAQAAGGKATAAGLAAGRSV